MNVQQQIKNLTNKLNNLVSILEKINFEDRIIIEYKPEEIKKYCEQSGLSLSEIRDVLQTYILKKPISITTASYFVNGQIKNIKLNSLFIKFLIKYSLKS